MAHNRRPGAVLAWRPVVLFGGGLGLAVFEAAQPMLGRRVEWAIVSLAATMMGLEAFQRSQEPREPTGGPPGSPGSQDGPGQRAGPGSPGSRGSPGALAVRAAPVARATPSGQAGAAGAGGPAGRVPLPAAGMAA